MAFAVLPAIARAQSPDLTASGAAAMPSAFSPNADSIKDTTTLSATFTASGGTGLAADDARGLANARRAPFYLDSAVVIRGPGAAGLAVRTITSRQTVDPVLRPKGTPANRFTVSIPLSIVWDGRTDSNAIAPDGVYTVDMGAALRRGPAGRGLAPGPAERTLALSNTVSITILLDTAPPALSIASVTAESHGGSITTPNPADGTVLADATPTFTVDYADALSGVDASTFHAARNVFFDLTADASATATNATVAVSTARLFPEGSSTFGAQITDLAGNTGLGSVTVVVDTVSPAIAISPADGASEEAAVGFTISIAITDATTGVDPASVAILINGVDQTAAFTSSGDTYTFTPSLTALAGLALGPNTMEVSARDRAQNPAEASATFTLAQPAEGTPSLFPTTPPPPVSPRIEALDCSRQRGIVTRCTPHPFKVRVTDGVTGAPLGGYRLTFRVTAGEATLVGRNPGDGTAVDGTQEFHVMLGGEVETETFEVSSADDPAVTPVLLSAEATAPHLHLTLPVIGHGSLLVPQAPLIPGEAPLGSGAILMAIQPPPEGETPPPPPPPNPPCFLCFPDGGSEPPPPPEDPCLPTEYRPMRGENIAFELGRWDGTTFTPMPELGYTVPEQGVTNASGFAPVNFVLATTGHLEKVALRISAPSFPDLAPQVLEFPVAEGRAVASEESTTGESPLSSMISGGQGQIGIDGKELHHPLSVDVSAVKAVLEAQLAAIPAPNPAPEGWYPPHIVWSGAVFLNPDGGSFSGAETTAANLAPYFPQDFGAIDFAPASTGSIKFTPAGPGPWRVGVWSWFVVDTFPGDLGSSVGVSRREIFAVGRPEVGYVRPLTSKPAHSVPNQILEFLDLSHEGEIPAVFAEIRAPKGFPNHLDAVTGEEIFGAEIVALSDCGEPVRDDSRFPPVAQFLRLCKIMGASNRFDLYRSLPIVSTLDSVDERPAATLAPHLVFQRVDGGLRLREEEDIFGLDEVVEPDVKVHFVSQTPSRPVEVIREPHEAAIRNIPKVVNGRLNFFQDSQEKITLRIAGQAKGDRNPLVRFTQSAAFGSTNLGREFNTRLAPSERDLDFQTDAPAAGEYTDGDIAVRITFDDGRHADDHIAVRVAKAPIDIGMNVWILKRLDGSLRYTKEEIPGLVARLNEIWIQVGIRVPQDQVEVHDPVAGASSDGTKITDINLSNANAVDVLHRLVRNPDGTSRLNPQRINIFFVNDTSTRFHKYDDVYS